jgi:lipid II:glycine glycyltransferase (peptidoglycan interpeptide bridge formation enzyme)
MPDRFGSPADTTWDTFVARHPHGHALQTSRWAQLKTAFGWIAGRAATAGSDGVLLGGASLLFRKLPWGQTLAYAPKGPLVNWNNTAMVTATLAAMVDVCRANHAAVLKIEPELEDTLLVRAQFTDLGLQPSPQSVQPRSTIHLDLTPDEATLLERMKPKWRYNIRLAERKGVTVRQGAPEDLPAIQALLEQTGTRDGFHVHSAAYYAEATALLVPAGMATWLLAEHEGNLLAAIAVTAWGHMACYLWGASGDTGRNLMPNHALQWAGMRWAKARGCTLYDLWGIPDAVGDCPEAYADPESWGEDGLWGVYRFKQGFGGRVVRYVGAWDLPISSAGHRLYRAALKIRSGIE